MVTFIIICIILITVMVAKNLITFRHHEMIIEAIYEYKVQCFKNREWPVIDYSDMEDYKKTFLRVWDWSYKRILPEEKMSVIKSYIKK